MRCVKCQGLVIDDAGEVRCLNCGARPYQAMRPAPVADEAAEVEGDGRQDREGIEKGAEMPRFKTEEGRQRWMDAMAARRGQKRGVKTVTGGARPCLR